MPRQLTVLVPALFWPDPAEERPYAGLSLPALQRLLGRGSVRRIEAPSTEAWLAQRFGLPTDAELPGGALTLLAHALDPAGRGWMRADPVHLRPQGTELFLVRGADLDISPDEAAALAGALETLTRDHHADFRVLAPGAWVVATGEHARLRTTPVSAAHGRSIDPLLPRGEDARHWMRLLSEMQMLLHAHPVNEARERTGRPTVNSLWFWGAGGLPDALARPFDAIASPDPVTRGLALRSGARTPAVSRWADLASLGADNALLDFRAAENAAARGDGEAWRGALADLDDAWLAPALRQLGAGRLARVSVVGLGARAGIEAGLGRGALRRFWRRPVPLGAVRPR